MKKHYYNYVLVLMLTMVFTASSLAYAEMPDKKQGKHKSHKKAKKKSSGYFYNFQH
ncbi:MAG: hypothetical protein ACJ75J_17205 [Cytophagaceae bacterium]